MKVQSHVKSIITVNKCILINKWYYKTVVLNIGPRMRRPQPSARPGRSARNRPLAAARLGPAALRTEMKKEERMRELWYNVQGLKILYYFVSLKEIDIIIII